MGILNFVLNQFLRQPVILMGLLIFIGALLGKKGFVRSFVSSVSAMVGLFLIIFGGGQFGGLITPITDAVRESFGVQGYIMDQVVMNQVAIENLTENNIFHLIGYVFLIAFAVNLVLAIFSKYTKVRGLFLTGNAGISHSQAVLWLVFAYFGTTLSEPGMVLIAGLLIGLYWSISTTLAIKPINKITDGSGGFTVGHNQTLAFWFYSKFAHLFGDPEKDDAENIKLPGWLSIFDNNILAVSIIMTVFCGGFLLSTGLAKAQEVAGDQHVIIYLILLGIQFSAYMAIVLQGVRMLTTELTTSFQGIQQRLVPNSVPAIDVAAVLAYGPKSSTLGFVFTTLGTVLGIVLLIVFKSKTIVLPGFIPLFFAGGPIGVLANKYGGWKSIIVCCTSLGLIQTFGTVWALSLTRIPDAIGWSGMFDFSTFWPAITEIFKAISKIFVA